MSYPILFAKTERKHIPAIAGIAVAGISVVGDTQYNEPFMTLGLGTLVDAVSCQVTEERNGAYELTMEYPINGVHFNEITQRCFIFAKPNYIDDPQPFRVYKITKPLNGRCTIYARHISYDLSGFEIEGGLTASNASLALALLNQKSQEFDISGQVSGTAEFKTDVPSSIRSWFGGKQGSLIDLYGGEWHYDGYKCQLMANRGADRGVTIRYGKNLTTLKQDEACSNVYSLVRGYWQSTSDEKVVSSSLISTGISLDPDRVFFLDCSSDFQEEPTVAELDARVITYIQSNNLSQPDINLELDFVQLPGLVNRVDLCDIVTIQFEELGVDAKAKCIKTTWNVLKDVYDKVSFGDAVSLLSTTLSDIKQTVSGTDSVLRKMNNDFVAAMDRATALISGNLGGYVVMHDSDGDGHPDEILVMDQPSIEDAVKIWRWNKSGLGYSSTGYAGPYGLAMTADGQIVADFITAGTMSADLIRGGTLQLGGINNTDGVLQVLAADGTILGSWDNTGIVANAGYIGDWTLANGILSAVSGLYTNTLSAQEIETKERLYSSSMTVDRITRLRQGDLQFYSQPLNGTEQPLLKIGPAYDNSNNAYASFGAYKAFSFLPGSGGSVGYRYGGSEGAGSYGAWHYFGSSVRIASTLTVTGSKSRAVDTENYAERLLYAYETPAPMFGDVGEGEIGEDGLCYVWLDPIFAETINTDQYQVFLQKYGDGDCWVEERKPNHFVVRGFSGLSFGWEIKAKQIDFSQRRLDRPIDEEYPLSTLGEDAATYISTLKEGRMYA